MKHKLPVMLISMTIITCKADLGKTEKLERALKEQEIKIVKETKKIKTKAIIAEAKLKTAKKATEKALKTVILSATSIKEAQETSEKSNREKEDAKNEKAQIEREKLKIENEAKQLEVQLKEKWNQQQTQFKIDEAKLELKRKTKDIERLLIIYDNDYGIEPSDQFGMHDSNSNNKAFDVLHQGLKPYHHADNKKVREKIYLVFEYKDIYIQSLGEILNKIAKVSYLPPDQAKQKTLEQEQANALLNEIIENIHEYFAHYFEGAFKILSDKQNSIDALNLSDLRTLLNKLNELQKIKDTCKMYAETIYNDFKNDKGKIRTGGIKELGEYITNHEYKKIFKDAIEQIKTLDTQISNITYK
ncbi:hypothetical protein A7978_04405 (plasmid) [Borrelia turicatae]|uniref:Uncharacterized protein n=1 Tax=Borrelia turicatae TaxID=142 RepID=A0A172XCE3_BORTU|nr:virulence associated lipoprotein [Borrelia turicatae]ANF34355.1 hypothetical protein A7978_04405 [Borrelia turicatae]UPA15433.1 hypothetical protein btBTE5EL_001113 [Borrelia turicatae]